MSLTEILHELVDAAHIARTITDNRRGELHQAVDDLDHLAQDVEEAAPEPEQAAVPAAPPA